MVKPLTALLGHRRSTGRQGLAEPVRAALAQRPARGESQQRRAERYRD